MTQYSQFLNDEAVCLVDQIKDGDPPSYLFREEDAKRVRELIEAGRSVLLIGPTGVGKSTIVHGVADALACEACEEPHIYSVTSSLFLAGTRYLGEWQTKVQAMLEQIEREDESYLYVSDVWNLKTVGHTETNRSNVWDVITPALEAKRLVLIAEATPEVAERLMRDPSYEKLLTPVHVSPLTPEQVDQLLERPPGRPNLRLTEAVRHTLRALPSRFRPDRVAPGPSLELLEQVARYAEDKARIGEAESITPQFVEKVFSIYSGLPPFIVSSEAAMSTRDIRAWFQERLIGQTDAIDAVIESITLFKAGLQDPSKPIGTFLFVGPTGVGKTELARNLASFLFGSPHRLLRFDLSEYTDYRSVARLIGDPITPSKPAELLDPVRANPFQVILFDELEKATPEIWDLLLPLLDDGRLSPPGGQSVSFKNSIIICTSNAGVSTQPSTPMGFGAEQETVSSIDEIRDNLGQIFRPEFLNRFQNITVFKHLTRSQIRRIARLELDRILVRDGITKRHLMVDVQDSALDWVIEAGYDREFGARALKRELQSRLVLPLAITLMERVPEAGSLMTVIHDGDRIRVKLMDTEQSRAESQLREPIRVDGKTLTPEDISTGIQSLSSELSTLNQALRITEQRDELTTLGHAQKDQEFWRDHTVASEQLQRMERLSQSIRRIDRLEERLRGLRDRHASSESRKDRERTGHSYCQLKEAFERTQRELIRMNPEGYWDALLQISPIAGDECNSRDILIAMYQRWTEHHGAQWNWLRIPLNSTEPALIHIQGHFTFGYLERESGIHRIQSPEGSGATRIRVIPWNDSLSVNRVDFVDSRAIKGTEAFGERIKSRLECPRGLVLQNGNTLSENQELARELYAVWTPDQGQGADVIRRYQLEPTHIRDVATGWSSGRRDALTGASIHQLLVLRIDTLDSEDEGAD